MACGNSKELARLRAVMGGEPMTLTIELSAGVIATCPGEQDEKPEVESVQVNGEEVKWWTDRDFAKAAIALADATPKAVKVMCKE